MLDPRSLGAGVIIGAGAVWGYSAQDLRVALVMLLVLIAWGCLVTLVEGFMEQRRWNSRLAHTLVLSGDVEIHSLGGETDAQADDNAPAQKSAP